MQASLNAAFSLEGRTALVTGGGRGIGAAIALAFAQAGAKVWIANRTAQAGEEIAALLRSQGFTAQAAPCDVGREDECTRCVQSAVDAFGGLDIVVHNAAINPWSPLGNIQTPDIEKTLAVNLMACFWLSQAALPYLRKAGKTHGGRILVTSSVTGPRVAMPGGSAYAASKAGVNGFIRSAALELAREGITVNGVEPGYIAKVGGSLLSNPEKAQRIARHIPIGQLGRPDDIAHTMLFLASSAARYITGQTIVVDGGSTLPESPIFQEN